MTDHALRQLIAAFVKALESGDILFLDKFLTPDVVYARLNPRSTEVHGKEEVIARMEPFFRAFVGWSFNAGDITPDPANRQVTCSLHITGENRGEMDFRAMGQGYYGATGKAFSLPPGRLMLTARGAQIQRIEIEFADGGGLVGIFQQIGPHR